MKNQNKPIEIVHPFENTWEKNLEKQEQTLFGEFGLNSEDEIYEAELVETGNFNLESNLVHKPSFTNKQKLLFLIKIELNDFYLTDASVLGSFLWFHSKVK